MGETLTDPEIIRRPADVVHDYLVVLQGTALDKYRAAEGMLDNVLYENTPGHRVMDAHTPNAADALEALMQNPSAKEANRFQFWRGESAIHLVRSMVAGKKFPIDQFGEVIKEIEGTVADIEGVNVPSKKIRHMMMFEAMDVYDRNDPEIIARCAEVLKHTTYKPRHFRSYGKLVARAARLEAIHPQKQIKTVD